ncbi:SPFH domain-containing protein [Paenibacillus sp. GCM10027626]|uniref:SPFH domain-containing protein n=1 Tax=Paenibacillus sp. GCM10027626 TaxID=3273411 RepID=UPI00363A3389
MGLFSFIKGQFIEVIEWLDDSGSMVYRFPAYDNAIKMGAKLIVRESQAAIFVNEGQIADVFGPGTYTLSTQNMPLMTALESWPHAFHSPFKADVFFVSTANFTNLKWGTTNPVIMRDAEFGAVRLRGFGSYSIKVGDPAVFLWELFGTRSDFSTEQISGFLKSIIVTAVSDLISESRIPVMDLAASYEELSATAAQRLQPRLAGMGLSLTMLNIENLSLPEEVERMIDRKSSMNIAGNLDQYMKYQTAEAIREAANNPESGAAGTGAELGAGMAMGQMMGQMMSQMMNQQPQQQAQPPVQQQQTQQPMNAGGAQGQSDTGKKFCSECGERLGENAKFCSNCGTKV